ncbi:lysophospholipid acyltransferase family protein [Undibacterium sp. Dicai25W]|uniref:lysophospholipid acyltransferase family protein n=1 Tax=Undibacterium sp. Dicai25W TaxID=3413034 RepID=UPI003BF21B6B
MLVTLFRFLSIFPLPVLHFIGAILGRIVYLLSGSYRRRLQENLARAGFSEHLGDAIREAGKNVLELPFIWCAKPERVLATATMENWELLQQALDAKKGVILLTPHLGCFEIVAQMIAARTRLTVLYRPPRKAALKPLIEGARARDNLLLAAANLSGVRIMAKALKKGEAIGLLPDQVPQEGEGVWANFFGKKAYTMTLSAKLHSMNGAPIILTYAERLPHGKGYVVRFVKFDEELTDDVTQQAEAINRSMEKLIARSPGQYFWSYNRYKKPEGVDGPEASTAQEQA